MSFGPILDTLQRRSSPQQREWIASLRRASKLDDRSPEAEQARAAIARSVHGIDAATWVCVCGSGYSYPSSFCPSCRARYPRRCLADGCGNAISGDDYAAGVLRCEDCAASYERQSRAASFARSNIPLEARHAAMAFSAGYEHQVEAGAVLKRWLSAGPQALPWRRDRTHVTNLRALSMLYLAGSKGSGKTTLAARLVSRAFVDLGLVDSFVWHSHESLADLFQARFSPDDGERQAAMRAWQLARFTPLLVVDDLFTRALTPAFSDALGGLLRERLDDVLPTVATSNHVPNWSEYFADVGRLESRFARDGQVIKVSGVDIRVEQAKARAA